MTAICAIGLGANLGDPEAMMERAINLLRLHEGLSVSDLSSTWYTEPVGGPEGQGWYYNRVALVVSELEAIPLLRALLALEVALGRVRAERWGPRLIDLDLLFRAQEIIEAEELTLPHPRMHERGFVLQPLAEVAPDWVHPVKGLSVTEMLARLPKDGPVVQKLPII
ncbi:MAG: 2-amino-4-hydroxy-6-hydroxymethyldihydropteridine diphosphokinase [Deltaproteobacteria bacterium]|nr:2-amino-4-hydroxy-6-hydroxymethyldihydropteridine diphosphokinase [Deltaproteobacteria bacterium]